MHDGGRGRHVKPMPRVVLATADEGLFLPCAGVPRDGRKGRMALHGDGCAGEGGGVELAQPWPWRVYDVGGAGVVQR